MFIPANLGSHCLLWSTKAVMQMFRSKIMTVIHIQVNELWSSEWSLVEKNLRLYKFEWRVNIHSHWCQTVFEICWINHLKQCWTRSNCGFVEAYSCYKAVVGWPWLDTRCPPKPLYHSPFSAGQRRENMTKGSWIEGMTGTGHSPSWVSYCHGQTRLDLGKLV